MSTCHSAFQRSTTASVLMLWFVLCFIPSSDSFSIQTKGRQQLRPRQILLLRPEMLCGDSMIQKAHIGGSSTSTSSRKCSFLKRGIDDDSTCTNNNPFQPTTTSVENTKNKLNCNRRYVLSLVGSNIIAAAATITTTVVVADAEVTGTNDIPNEDATIHKNNNNNLTTELFNADGSLRDTELVVEAKERTITLLASTNEPSMKWVDGMPSSRSTIPLDNTKKNSGVVSPMVQYNVPMKWDKDYIDSTSKERACTRIYTYQIPYQKVNSDGGSAEQMTSNADTSKKAKRRLISSSNMNNGAGINRRLEISDIIDALPKDDSILPSLRNADIMGGNVRRPTGATIIKSGTTDNDDTSKARTNRIYSDFDLAVAPTTCSGGESEDLRLGFCPYDRIFLVSATVTNTFAASSNNSDSTIMNTGDDMNSRSIVDGSKNIGPEYLSLLIVESTRSEWQRANADLRRVRGSFIVI